MSLLDSRDAQAEPELCKCYRIHSETLVVEAIPITCIAGPLNCESSHRHHYCMAFLVSSFTMNYEIAEAPNRTGLPDKSEH